MITAKYLILFFLFGVVLLIRIEKAYQLTLLLMIFTRLSFADIGGDSILVCHVFTLLLLFRIFFGEKCFMKICIPKQLIIFTAYMGISVFLALFHGDTYVINVDNQYAPVKFSVQQFTQYAYLLHAVIFMAMTSDLLVKGRMKTDDVWKALDLSYVLVIALGFLQLIMPIETFDFYFRDSMIGGASQTINGFHRIDSTFGEPSMLMLFLSPLFCRYLYGFLSGRTTAKNLMLVIAGGWWQCKTAVQAMCWEY